MKNKILIISAFIIFIVLITILIVVDSNNQKKFYNDIIGKTFGNGDFIYKSSNIYSEYKWKVKFINEDECVIYTDDLFGQIKKQKVNPLETFCETRLGKFKYQINSFNKTIELLNDPLLVPKSFKLKYENNKLIGLDSEYGDVFESNRTETRQSLYFEDITNNNQTNMDNPEGTYYFEAKEMPKFEYVFKDVTKPNNYVERNPSTYIYTYVFVNKEKADEEYKEYQRMLHEDFGLTLQIKEDYVYVYKNDKMISVFSAGLDSKLGYFIKISFENIYYDIDW